MITTLWNAPIICIWSPKANLDVDANRIHCINSHRDSIALVSESSLEFDDAYGRVLFFNYVTVDLLIANWCISDYGFLHAFPVDDTSSQSLCRFFERGYGNSQNEAQ